jgi:mono/diheme cytochrome c family protein
VIRRAASGRAIAQSPAPCHSSDVSRARWIRRLTNLGVCGLLLPFAACRPAPLDCPNDNPSCPDPAPSYASDIGPLIGTYCARCHSPDGSNAGLPLQSYDEVTAKQQIAHVLFQISSCRMPPSNEAQPSADERRLILSWFACCAASDAGTCPP